jgi:tetratricopeptide (TPR) repeat protein
VVRRVTVAALAVWAVFFAVTAASELVLQQAVERVAADPVAANEMFGGAASIRPWDADLPSIAAETFAAAADASAQQEESPGAQTAESAHFAITWANRSLERTPATQGSLQARGVASQALGDLDAAAADFARVAEGNATAQQATYRWGVVEALRGNFDAAREHLEVASRLDPADAAPWSALAYVYQELGLADEADAANAKAIALEG